MARESQPVEPCRETRPPLLSLPVDRGQVRTEQRHPGSEHLDQLSAGEIIALMAEDHRAVPEAVLGAQAALASFIDIVVERVQRGGRLIYLGAGTSGRLGVLDASECPPTFRSAPGLIVGVIAGGDSALRQSSEGMEDDPDGARAALDQLQLGKDDIVLGIAAGGTTPYVLGGIRLAKARGAATGLLTCAPRHERPEACDHLIVLNTGPEILTGSTRLKAGSATKLALNIITTATFTRLGKVYRNLMVDLRATNDKLRDRAIRVLIMLFPEMSREAAAQLLARAGGELKTAIVMQALQVDAGNARERLNACGGRLGDVMDRPEVR